MTILFFGSDPWFSPPVLEALISAGHEVPVVITKGEALRKFIVHGSRFMVQANSTADISKEHLQTLLRQSPAAIVVAAFGPPFLPDDLLDWPRNGCLNVHASLLPRWRGASPVFAAIAAGDRETGVTIMRMTKEIDRGSILRQARMTIHQPSFKRTVLGVPASSADGRQGPSFPELDTRETLTKRLGVLGGELIVKTIGQIGQIRPIGQPRHSPTPYTYRLKKEDGRIDWSKSPEETERFIRAMTPWPGARSAARWQVASGKWQVAELTILKASLSPSSLIPTIVQLPGKNPTSWKQFLVGHPRTKLL